MPRDAFPAPTGILDNDANSHENTGTEIRESDTSSTSEASDLPDGIMDVPQAADYLRVPKTSAHKTNERQKNPPLEAGGCCVSGRMN